MNVLCLSGVSLAGGTIWADSITPFTALRATVPTGGRRSLAGGAIWANSMTPFTALRATVPTGGRRSKPSAPPCRSEGPHRENWRRSLN